MLEEEKNITQLEEKDRNLIKNKSAFILPDNPSEKGFNAVQIKKALYEPVLLLFDWLKRQGLETDEILTMLKREDKSIITKVHQRATSLELDNINGIIKLIGKDENENDIELSSIDLPLEDYVYSKVFSSITYLELVELRNNSKLVPGCVYRITDYVTTSKKEGTRSAGHRFDIIVFADSENTLNEIARAVKHDGETYFDKCNINKWELKYSLDNDINKYDWVDEENGKGVIYWLKDEYNNECCYDFKNIQYLGSKIKNNEDNPFFVLEDEWYYTFSNHLARYEYFQWGTSYSVFRDETSDTVINGEQYYGFKLNTIPSAWSGNKFLSKEEELTQNSVMYTTNGDEISYGGSLTINEEYGIIDTSLKNEYTIHNNIIKSCNPESHRGNFKEYPKTLNVIVFLGVACYSNTFGNYCKSNTFGKHCRYNTFGADCSSNTFGDYCYSNTFGNYCNSNTFETNCSSNTFGDYCSNHTFGNYCNSNTFVENCQYNTFGDYCQYNTFGNYCNSNTFETNCSNHTFGENCSENVFKINCANNTLSAYSSNNTLNDYSSFNILFNCSNCKFNYPNINYITIKNGKNVLLYSDIFMANTYPMYVEKTTGGEADYVAYRIENNGNVTYYTTSNAGNGNWVQK